MTRSEHPVSVYAKVCNLLLQAQAYLSKGEKSLGVSCLVAAEQAIPAIENLQQFLCAQVSAGHIWRDHLIQNGLENHTKSGEFKIHNYWSVA